MRSISMIQSGSATTTHRFRYREISVRCSWDRGMWVDLQELLAFVLSSEEVDVVLIVIGFQFIKTGEHLPRIDCTWITVYLNSHFGAELCFLSDISTQGISQDVEEFLG